MRLARRVRDLPRPRVDRLDGVPVDELGVERFAIPEGLPTAPPDDVLQMGAHSYNRPRVEWYLGDTHHVFIGNYCSIHTTVLIFVGGEHRMDYITTYAVRERYGRPGAFRSGMPHSRGDVHIGNDVYIGVGATVLSGVTIGNGAVIGARAVITRDVPAYSVWAGNPGRQVKWRFTERQRISLQRIAWWNWSDDVVAARADLLSSPDIDEFCRTYDPAFYEG
jgi:acetyltransferase-like isoleucine patch superfamily enzyme